MEQSIFVAMCQVNIAIGLVYLGFREFRYKNILEEKGWKAFTRTGCDNMPYNSDKHTADSKFSTNWHYVMDFAKLYLTGKVPSQLAASLSNRVVRRRFLWKFLSWYINLPDKIAVVTITVLLPTVLLWANTNWSWMLAVGQILIALQVAFVWIEALTVARRILKRGLYVVTVLDRKGIDNQIEAIRPN